MSASSDNAAGLKSQRERLADMLSANGGELIAKLSESDPNVEEKDHEHIF